VRKWRAKIASGSGIYGGESVLHFGRLVAILGSSLVIFVVLVGTKWMHTKIIIYLTKSSRV